MVNVNELCKNVGLSEEEKKFIFDNDFSDERRVMGILGFADGLTKEQIAEYFVPENDWFTMYLKEVCSVRKVDTELADCTCKDRLFDLIVYALS